MKFGLTEPQIIDLLNGITVEVQDPKTSKTYSLVLDKCIQSDDSGRIINHFKLDTGQTICVLNSH